MKRALYSTAISTLLASVSAFAQSSIQPPAGTGYVRFDIFTRGELPSPCTGYSSRTLYQTSGTQSILSLTQCESFVFISVNENGSGQTPDIGRIGITGGTPKRRTAGGTNQGAVEIVLVDSVPAPSPGQNPVGIPPLLQQPAPVGRDFGGVVAVGSNSSEVVPHYEFFGRIGRDVKSLGGALSSEVFVNSIAAFWADGDVLVPFTFYRAKPTLGTNIVSAKSIQASIQFQSFSNDVVLSGTNGMTLEATDGDIGVAGNPSPTLLTGVGAVRATSANPAKGNIYSNLNGSLPSQILATGNFGSPSAPRENFLTVLGTASGGDPDRIDVGGVFRANITSGSNSASNSGNYLSRFVVGTLDGSVNFWSARSRPFPGDYQVIISNMTPNAGFRIRQQLEIPATIDGGVPVGASVVLRRNSTETVAVTGGTLRAPLTINGDINGTVIVAGLGNFVQGSGVGNLTLNGNVNSVLQFGSLDSSSSNDSGTLAGAITINGDVAPAGQIVSRRAPGNLRINGRLKGLLAIAADELPNGSTAGGFVNPFWSFGNMTALGLDGQIVINTNTPTTQTYTWNTPVFVSGTVAGASPLTVVSNIYPELSSVLSDDSDGGAVGHAPYRLHVQDALPANDPLWSLTVNPVNQSLVPLVSMGLWITNAPWNAATIRSRFYGPIRTSSVSTNINAREYGVRVQRANLDASGAITGWVDATGRFTGFVDTSPARIPNALLSRDFILRPACGVTPGLYRAIRTNDFNNPARVSRLHSRYTGEDRTDPVANTAGDDEFVNQFAHYFRLSAPGDVAGAGQTIGPDGDLTADDTVVFINWFFAFDPRADVAGQGQTIGSDGVFTADDIIVFIGWFFADPATFVYNTADCTLPIIEEEPNPESSTSGTGSLMSAPVAASNTASVGTPVSDQSTRPQQIAVLQAMINAETDPQRRALLEAALAMLLAETQ
jgi:hypothetical protein